MKEHVNKLIDIDWKVIDETDWRPYFLRLAVFFMSYEMGKEFVQLSMDYVEVKDSRQATIQIEIPT